MGGRAALKHRIETRPQSDQLQSNGFQHSIKVAENFVVGESQQREAHRAQYNRALRVSRRFRLSRMGGAVDFEDEARLQTGEVDNEAAQNDLASKFETSDLFAPYAGPKAALGGGRFTAQFTSERQQTARHGATPLPNPPPQGGRSSRLAAARLHSLPQKPESSPFPASSQSHFRPQCQISR